MPNGKCFLQMIILALRSNDRYRNVRPFFANVHHHSRCLMGIVMFHDARILNIINKIGPKGNIFTLEQAQAIIY